MRDQDELTRNLSAFLEREGAATILAMLDVLAHELHVRALPGVADVVSGAHKLSLYVEAYRCAHPAAPIHSEDCATR